MLNLENQILRHVIDDLASRLSPSSFDLSIGDVLQALTIATEDRRLSDALAAVAPLLEGTSSGLGLDLAYGAPGAPFDLRTMCNRLEGEIDVECAWLEAHPESWATGHEEFLEVISEFVTLGIELRRVASTLRRAAGNS